MLAQGGVVQSFHRLRQDLVHAIVAESASILSACRVIVNGNLARDVVTPIPGGRSPATMKIILPREIEAG